MPGGDDDDDDDLELDAERLEYVLSTAPPPFALGSQPPPEILASLPPLAQRRVLTVPPGPGTLVEQVAVSGVTAVRESLTEPPGPATGPHARARAILRDLARTGPGDEAPLVQSLLRIGEGALPAIGASFPGCLWFDRRLPHAKVARGRDVSAVARALVAFGPAAAPILSRLARHDDEDIRFYAALVAAEIESDALARDLGELALDPSGAVRQTATAALRSMPPSRSEPARAALRDALVRGHRAARATRALARLRDAAAVPLLVARLASARAEASDLERALTAITGHDLGDASEAWRAWLEAHGAEPRERWLVDALETDDPMLFGHADRELKAIDGRDEAEESPPDDLGRARVREAWRAWLSMRSA